MRWRWWSLSIISDGEWVTATMFFFFLQTWSGAKRKQEKMQWFLNKFLHTENNRDPWPAVQAEPDSGGTKREVPTLTREISYRSPAAVVHSSAPPVTSVTFVFQAGSSLFGSLTTTSRNIGMLRIVQKKLQDDKRSKSAAADVDSTIVRMRRSRADRRWCLGSAF